MPYTFFTITVPKGNAKEWACNYWDTYGFDYDLERTTKYTVCAWASECSDEELKEALNDDGIEYTTLQVESLDRFLGATRYDARDHYQVGDRVRWCKEKIEGTVTAVDKRLVYVRWDDLKEGVFQPTYTNAAYRSIITLSRYCDDCGSTEIGETETVCLQCSNRAYKDTWR